MDSDEQGSCREGREPERSLLELRLVDPPHRGDTGQCPQPEGWHEQRVDEQARRGDEAESGAGRKSGQATRRRRPLRCTPTWSLSATSRCCATVTGPEQLAVLAAGLGAGSLTSTVGVASLLSVPELEGGDLGVQNAQRGVDGGDLGPEDKHLSPMLDSPGPIAFATEASRSTARRRFQVGGGTNSPLMVRGTPRPPELAG